MGGACGFGVEPGVSLNRGNFFTSGVLKEGCSVELGFLYCN